MSGTGELSKLFEIDRTTLNYYVKSGLLQPAVSKNQYHQYGFSDSMALAFIRYYRGLGFSTDEITKLLCADTAGEKILRMKQKHDQLQEHLRLLQLKILLIENLQDDFSFIQEHPEGTEGLCSIKTEPYFFIPKKELENDPQWMDLYRMIPSIEFSARYDRNTEQFEIPDLFLHSGISVKESWLHLLSIDPPSGSVYYPARDIRVVHFSLTGASTEKELSEKLHPIFCCESADPSLSGNVVFYLFPHDYDSEEAGFNCLCFLD